MQKIIAVIHKLDNISREEFLHRWQVEHPAYVRQLPGLRRYVQNPAIEHKSTWPADGVAELWFDSLRDIAAAFEGPAADALREHEEHFIGKIDWFVATETEVPVEAVPTGH